MDIEQLRQRLVELNEQAQQLRARASADKRDLTVEEEDQLKDCLRDFEQVSERIEQLTQLEDQTARLNRGGGRKTEAEQPAQLVEAGANNEVALARQAPQDRSGRNGAPPDRRRVPATLRPASERNGGFRTLGEFAYSVRRASVRGGHLDPRLELTEQLAATTYGNETSGTDGGFAVPADFRTAIMDAVMGEQSLISRTDQVTVTGNSFTAPVDMTTPWQTSGGIQAYWGVEAGTKTQSKPQLQERTTKLNKLYALVPMTDEILEDAPAMDAYLRRKAPEKIGFAANLSIVQGTGVGQPLGFLNSGALVSVAKESGQVADTLVANNIIKMYSRMIPSSVQNAVWLINPDIYPQLFKLSIAGTDNTGNSVSGWGGLVYTPANGFAGAPFGTLFGRPVIPSQAMETLGDLGDIAFVDLSQYLLILKSGPNPKVDVSMHLWFDQDVTAYRFVLRLGGVPWWDTAVSARDGSSTYSPFVALAERA